MACGACGPHTPGFGEFRSRGCVTSRGLRTPEPRGSDLVGATRPHAPGFTISHLNALRATVRIEAYGLYAQK